MSRKREVTHHYMEAIIMHNTAAIPNSELYFYNLYQAYYTLPAEKQQQLISHVSNELGMESPSGFQMNSLSDEDRAVILHKITTALGYNESEADTAKKFMHQKRV